MAGIGEGDVLLAPPEDLLVLERGTDEILLCHPVALEPVYMPKGREFVKKLLGDIGAGSDRAGLYAANKEHRELLRLLERHRILENPAQAMRVSPRRGGDGGHDYVVTYLTVTTACNLRCVYCLGGKEGKRRQTATMPVAVARRAVERACQTVNPGGTLEVTFFGGEPLGNWPLVKAVGEYVRQELAPRNADKSFSLSMVSNLAELPGDLIDWSLAHGMTFLCDIDGPPAVHDNLRPFASGTGSWRRITENVRMLTAAGVGVGLRMTLTAVNQAAMRETALLFRQLGARSCAFVPVQPVDIEGDYMAPELLPDIDVIVAGLRGTYAAGIWETDELFPLADYRSRMLAGGAGTGPGCGSFSGQTPVVDPDGAIYPCVYLAGDRRFRCGAAEGGAADDKACLSSLRERLSVDNLPACRRCPWRSLCGGGCSVPRLLIGADAAAPAAVKKYARDVNCAFVTAAYEMLLWERAARAYEALNGGGTAAVRRAGGAC